MILAIETSDRLCSVAFYHQGRTLMEFNNELPMQHTSLVGRWVGEGLSFIAGQPAHAGLKVHAVAVNNGPGSFTGLRIGLSYGRGYAYGKNLPMVALSNHQVLAVQAPVTKRPLFTLIHSRKGEVYLAEIEWRDDFPLLREHRTSLLEKISGHVPGDAVLALSPYLNLDAALKKEWRDTGLLLLESTRYNASLTARLGQRKLELFGPDEDKALAPMYIHPFAGSL